MKHKRRWLKSVVLMNMLFSVAAFAAEKPVDADNFYRSRKVMEKEVRFENQYHTSPVKYLKRIRLEHAAWLLRNTETSIKEIAFASGFSSLQSFCFVFKNTYGTSPGLFRK